MVNAQSQTADAVSSTNGSVFEIFPQTFTNSASLSTITNFVFNSVQQNVFGSTSATTITNIANMYIGAAPIAVNTNANIVNSYALWVDGATKLASLSVTSAATFGPLTSTSATISQLNVTGASNFVGQISATSISASNITVTSLSVTAPLNFTNLSVTTLNVSGPATFTGLSSFAATTISTLSAGLTTFTDTTMATASNAASVVMLGGLAVGKNIWVGTTGLTIGSGTNNNLSIYNDGTGTISNNTGPFLVQNTAASSFTMRNPATQDVFLFDTATTGNINVGTAATTGFVKIWSGTDSSGNTSGALQVVGGAGFGGKVFATEFNATSDVQYKTNIKPIEDPLGLVKKIEGYTYNWKSSFFGYNDKPQMGFIAQQLEEAGLDFMVTTDDNGSKSVNYLKIIAACAEAIKELDAKYEELKKASYKVEF
jgi:hypothetical protein